MAKKRKSREQKIKADNRHFSYHIDSSITHSVPQISIASTDLPIQINKPQPVVFAYPYLKNDLRKTIILTASILAIQLAIFIVLRNHIVNVLGIRY